MKALLLSLSAIAVFGPTAFCQSTATTTPVGFISESVYGGSLSAPKLSLISPTLTQPVVFQGTISSISGGTITVSGANWTVDQFDGANGEYYVEVFSATKPGTLSDITATATSSVTTADDLSTFAAAGDTIAIRKHITLNDLFGATNTFGLLASDDPTTADEIQIYDGTNSVGYFYYTGSPGFPAGWWDAAFSGPAGNVVIAPHDGVIVKRRGSGNVTIVSTGTVKTGNTLFPVYLGTNVVGTVSAQGLTLDSSGLFKADGSQFRGSDDPTTGDELTIYSGGTSISYFYYTGSPGFPAGWWDSAFTAQAGSVAIAPGTAFILKHRAGSAFNWTLPAPTTF